MKLICNEDCGNAPKKQYVLDFNVAFAENDIPAILEMLDENAEWDMIGNKKMSGRGAIKKELESMGTEQAKELNIRNILSHGKLCSANGEVTYSQGKIAFCNVYTFSSHSKNAKIVKIESYAIDIK